MNAVARLLRRLRCGLTDHDHETTTERGWTVSRCRRDCGWRVPSR